MKIFYLLDTQESAYSKLGTKQRIHWLFDSRATMKNFLQSRLFHNNRLIVTSVREFTNPADIAALEGYTYTNPEIELVMGDGSHSYVIKEGGFVK